MEGKSRRSLSRLTFDFWGRSRRNDTTTKPSSKTSVMEKERHHDDEVRRNLRPEEIANSWQALEEVRIIILHDISLSLSSPVSLFFSRARCIVFLPAVYETSKKRSRNDVRSRKAEIYIEKSRAEKRVGITKGKRRESGKTWTER